MKDDLPGLNPYQQGVVDRLRNSANIFEERAAVYKDNYRAVGRVMEALFPDGHTQHTQEDHNRWHLFELVIVKLTRYVNNYDTGGHEDSIDDMIVYLSMLGQLDAELRAADEEARTEDDKENGYDFRDPKLWALAEGGAVVDQNMADAAGVKLETKVETPLGVSTAIFNGIVFSTGDSVRFKQHRGRGGAVKIVALDPRRTDGLSVRIGTEDSGFWVHPAWLEAVSE